MNLLNLTKANWKTVFNSSHLNHVFGIKINSSTRSDKNSRFNKLLLNFIIQIDNFN